MGCNSSTDAVDIAPSGSTNPLGGLPRASACAIHPDPALEAVAGDCFRAGPHPPQSQAAAAKHARKHRSVSPKNFGRVVEEPTPEQQAARAAALAKLAAAHGITPDPGQFTAAGPDPAAARRSSVKCAQWIVAHRGHHIINEAAQDGML